VQLVAEDDLLLGIEYGLDNKERMLVGAQIELFNEHQT
jgi:hypothetical protein